MPPLAVTIAAAPAGGQSGSRSIGPFSIVGTTTFDEVDTRQLLLGDNTFTLPVAPGPPLGVVIDPPNANTAVLKIKGAAGDVGIVINKTLPTVITFDQGNLPASIIINAGTAFPAGSVIVLNWF